MSCRETLLVARVLFAVVEAVRPAVGGPVDDETRALVDDVRAALDRITGDASTTGCAPALLDTAHAAARLRVGPKTVQRWAAEGRFEGARKIGRRWLIPEASLATVGTAPRAPEGTPDAGPQPASPVGSQPGSVASASEAFAALTRNSDGPGHGKVVEHSKKSAPRDAPTSGGPGTGRKEASTMKHATVSALADARTHAIGRRGGR